MSKKKKSKVPSNTQINITLPDDLSVDEMIKIIAEGLMAFEERKKEREDQELEEWSKEWRQKLGIDDFLEVKRPKRWILKFRNRIKAFFKVLFMPRRHVKGNEITLAIVQLLLAAFFCVAFIALMVLGVTMITLTLFHIREMDLGSIVMFLSAGVVSVVASGLFKVASSESLSIKNPNYIFGLFTCVVSVASIIPMVVAFLAARM